MSTNIVKNTSISASLAEKFGFSDTQLDLIKRTVAKNATDDELELFFYRCKELGLNPLMPGQVYFLKFKKRNPSKGEDPWNAGTIIIGLEGFRLRAHATGKLSGIKRGVIRNPQGACVGGWADVYRSDWTQPAHEEVPLNEYMDHYKDTWKNMPETMIKKVAEVAALRMAFPNDFAGLYLREEFDKTIKEVESESSSPIQQQLPAPTIHPAGASTSPPSNTGVRKPSEAQMKRLWAITKSYEISSDEAHIILKAQTGLLSFTDLNLNQYNEYCDSMLSGKCWEILEGGSTKLDLSGAPSDFPPPLDEEPHFQ